MLLEGDMNLTAQAGNNITTNDGVWLKPSGTGNLHLEADSPIRHYRKRHPHHRGRWFQHYPVFIRFDRFGYADRK